MRRNLNGPNPPPGAGGALSGMGGGGIYIPFSPASSSPTTIPAAAPSSSSLALAFCGPARAPLGPGPHREGSYIPLFWPPFDLGGIIGGFITLTFDYCRKEAASVNDGTSTFLCFLVFDVAISLAILPR